MNDAPKASGDYLAICPVVAGAGSYARGPDREKVLADLKRIVRSDWKSLLKPAKKPFRLAVALWNVSGHDTVHYSYDGSNVWTEEDRGPDQPAKRTPLDAANFERVEIEFTRW